MDLSTEVQSLSLQMSRPVYGMKASVTVNDKMPLRFAEPIFTNLTPQNSGVWEEGVDGVNVWRLALKSGGAKSLNLIFDQFHLKNNDRVFIYNPQRTQVLGGFTKANNNPSKLFAVAPVIGDEIIVELQTESPIEFNHEIQISAVNHDYIGVFDHLKRAREFGFSADCNIDVLCESQHPEPINRSVCKIIVDGVEICSGTMLNNTKQDGTPYFLTAAHCIDRPTDATGSLTAQNVVFYFNFDSPNCNPIIEGSDIQTLSGAQLRAYVANMDFALLEMNKRPPETYRPYWAGWKRDVILQGPVYSVHHPQGDVKKIAVSDKAPVATSFRNPETGGVTFLTDNHWKVERWNRGTTESGSSGSGLFFREFLVGNLSGGEAYCGNSVNDYYVRFNRAWGRNANHSEQLAFWLDPLNSNATQLTGKDFFDARTIRFSPKRIDDDIHVKYDNQFKGSWSGHNERGYNGYANYYYGITKATLNAIYLVPAQSKWNSKQTINVKVWDGSTGKPGAVLWGKENVSIASLFSDREALFNVEPALELSNPVFVGVELNYASVVDTFSLYQMTLPVSTLNPKNRAYIRDKDAQWSRYDHLHSSGQNSAYWIDILVKDANITTDTGDIDAASKYVKILKNPVKTGNVEYETDIQDMQKAEVYALNGHLVRQSLLHGQSKGLVPVSGLPAGIYLVKFTSAKQAIVKRVVIAH